MNRWALVEPPGEFCELACRNLLALVEPPGELCEQA